MRERSQQSNQTVAGTWVETRLTDGHTTSVPFSQDTVVSESLMRDEPNGGNHSIKSCTHLRFDVESYDGLCSTFHSASLINIPNPGYRYDNAPWYLSICERWRPTWANGGEDYIPVTGMTTNDIDDCVFKAYNNYVNSVKALDASTSIAESGETPRLFEMWQRRKGAAFNLTSGFLAYSFGWKPLFSDFVAIRRELRSFPKTVARRLKAIGKGQVVRHYKFNLSGTINDGVFDNQGQNAPYEWGKYGQRHVTVNKRRTVVVTIRASVKPKLTGYSQDIVNRLGALGLIPSLATLWSVTRLSFVIDWFFNIGAAIENLQGSLTHDVSNVEVCVSDTRERFIEARCESINGPISHLIGRVNQRYYRRIKTTVPVIPVFRVPHRAMPYVLLGLIGLGSTKRGNRILRSIDGSKFGNKVNLLLNKGIDRFIPKDRAAFLKAFTDQRPKRR